MNKPSALLLAAFALLCGSLLAQTASGARDFTYTISTARAWTDTNLDLQAGDSLQISASAAPAAGNCDPNGAPGDATPQGDLPLPSAPAGALIARLHAQGATPLLIGAGSELRIEEPSHLFLGVNVAEVAPCQGSFVVKVHQVPPSGSSDAQPKSRSEALKSQLSSAAQVFMSGQFGSGKADTSTEGASNAVPGGSGAEAASAPLLKVSDTPLDSDLRKSIDGLPRRVNDQFKNLGDMVNFVILGSQKDVQAALDAANWHVADTTKQKAVLTAALETYENKDYLQMPMSTLYLFGRAQDFGYEQAEPIAMVASRHHFRIWKAPFTWEGHEVWVGAGTHDIGFAKDKRNGSVTHKIDPAVDGERDNIGSSLQKSGKAKTLTYYLPPSPVQDARNATGDGYHSDGRLLVIFLQ